MSANSTSITTQTPATHELDRRTFLGSVGLAAGAMLAASVVPPCARAAIGATPPDAGASQAALAEPTVEASAADLWDVDDMWGHRPRYAHAIPYAHGIPGAGTLERSGPYRVLGSEL